MLCLPASGRLSEGRSLQCKFVIVAAIVMRDAGAYRYYSIEGYFACSGHPLP